MKITICQVRRDGDAENRESIGEILLETVSDFGADASAEKSLDLLNGIMIEILVNYDGHSKSVTTFIKEDGQLVASLVARWDGGGLPYFAFCPSDGTLTELYFEK